MLKINLKQLEAFTATAEYGSFTKAAEELYLTQSTVSAHIHTLACRPPRSEVHTRVVHCALVPARSQEPASASTRYAHPQHAM
ncbi:hypothetical protein SDC9_208518 [bioreactor metagenome]|uniref:HTH lysR-type domain-containing protein n=1 Tax=bioreactor metagenome TaxID=1076179 RepID=A0A645JBG7_9ZZZZ